MTQAQKGDKVQVHYTGKLEDEQVFDTSENQAPLEFVLGEGRLIPGFEQAVIGMTPNESKSVKITADEAYGPRREELLVAVPRSEFPDNIDPQKGQQFEIRMDSGQTRRAQVADVTENHVTLDTNHPLAGQDLIFDIRLVNILSA
jgi:FKBP-type peptidyl-prolyl cis-trans isomerase 2